MNLEKLKGHVPDSVISEIPLIAEKFGINTPLRLAHFLAQASHESGKFKVVTENLNYSAEGLMKIFPKYFNATTAAQCARKPEKIANIVYAGRMSNGNAASGDGFKFCGRGYIQLTGRANYTLFDDFVPDNIVETPALVATKYPLLSAAWFFSKNGLNAIADTGSSDDVVTKITKRVNGATIGLPDRLKHFKEYLPLIS